MQLTLNDLRRFAFGRGITSHGTKYQLAELIAIKVDPETVRHFLSSNNLGKIFVRPLVTNLPLLKKYIWAELNRTNLYFQWLEQVYCLRIPPKRYTKEDKQRFQEAELKRDSCTDMNLCHTIPA